MPLHSTIIHDKKSVMRRAFYLPGPVTVQFNFEKKFHDENVVVVSAAAAVVFALLSQRDRKKNKQKFLIQTACSDRVIAPRHKLTHTAYSKGLHTRLAHQTGN